MIYKKINDFLEMLLFHSLMKKKLLLIPLRIPLPAWWVNSPGRHAGALTSHHRLSLNCPLYFPVLLRFQTEETKHVWWKNN